MNPEEDVEGYLNRIAADYSAQSGSYPEAPSKDTLLQFMRDVVAEDEPTRLTKASNLKEEEVGRPKIPSLTYFSIATYASSEGHDVVANYLLTKAGNLSTLSLGRKAKLLEVLFTVRRETRNLGTPRTTTKKGLFSETTTKEGTTE